MYHIKWKSRRKISGRSLKGPRHVAVVWLCLQFWIFINLLLISTYTISFPSFNINSIWCAQRVSIQITAQPNHLEFSLGILCAPVSTDFNLELVQLMGHSLVKQDRCFLNVIASHRFHSKCLLSLVPFCFLSLQDSLPRWNVLQFIARTSRSVAFSWPKLVLYSGQELNPCVACLAPLRRYQ